MIASDLVARQERRALVWVYTVQYIVYTCKILRSCLRPSCKSAVQTVQEMSKQLDLTLRAKMAEMKSDQPSTPTLQASLLIQVSVPL